MSTAKEAEEKYQQYLNSKTWQCLDSPTGAHWFVEDVCKFCGKRRQLC